jgi:hypothetical protein
MGERRACRRGSVMIILSVFAACSTKSGLKPSIDGRVDDANPATEPLPEPPADASDVRAIDLAPPPPACVAGAACASNQEMLCPLDSCLGVTIYRCVCVAGAYECRFVFEGLDAGLHADAGPSFFPECPAQPEGASCAGCGEACDIRSDAGSRRCLCKGDHTWLCEGP